MDRGQVRRPLRRPDPSRLHRRVPAAAKAVRRFGRPFQIAAGVIMVLMGVAMITGYLSLFAFWLLDTFPALGRIG